MPNPTLRFKQPNGQPFPDWEEKKLGEVCEIATGKLDANAMSESGHYRFYTCAKDFYQIDEYAFDTEALLISGNGANVGYIHYYKGKFNAYQRTYVLDQFDENILFIKTVLQKRLARRIETEKKDGNTPYIVRGTLADMPVPTPYPDEQARIAGALGLVDERIDLLKQKHTQLQQYKKGLMQKLFSQELRFTQPNGQPFLDWEERKLGEICEIIMGQSPSSSSYSENQDGLVLIQGNADIQDRKIAPRIWTSAPGKVCINQDVLMTVRAPVGLVALSDREACLGRGVCALRALEYSTPLFLYQYMIYHEDKWQKLSQGGIFGAVNGKDISGLKIMTPPHPDEQARIANALQAVDDKIAAVANQVQQAQAFKKGLMQGVLV